MNLHLLGYWIFDRFSLSSFFHAHSIESICYFTSACSLIQTPPPSPLNFRVYLIHPIHLLPHIHPLQIHLHLTNLFLIHLFLSSDTSTPQPSPFISSVSSSFISFSLPPPKSKIDSSTCKRRIHDPYSPIYCLFFSFCLLSCSFLTLCLCPVRFGCNGHNHTNCGYAHKGLSRKWEKGKINQWMRIWTTVKKTYTE